MTFRIQTHVLAGLTALGVALAGLSAQPARAGSDTARIITGLGALAIIGGAIANSHDRRDGVSRHGYRGDGYGYNRYGYGYNRHRGYGYNRQRGYGYKRYGYGYNRSYRHNRHYRRGYGGRGYGGHR